VNVANKICCLLQSAHIRKKGIGLFLVLPSKNLIVEALFPENADNFRASLLLNPGFTQGPEMPGAFPLRLTSS
jgi:hypothetical protein